MKAGWALGPQELQGVPCRVELAPALQETARLQNSLAGPDDGLVLELGAESAITSDGTSTPPGRAREAIFRRN
jgi:hypothetical protein